MALFKHSTSRRREVRKAMPRRRKLARPTLSRTQAIWGIGLACVFAFCGTWLVLAGRTVPRYVPGQYVDRIVTAQVPFQSVDPEKTEAARAEARRQTWSIYEPSTAFFEELANGLRALPGIAAKAPSIAEITPELQQKYGVKTDDMLFSLGRYTSEGETSEEWNGYVDAFMKELAKTALLPQKSFETERLRSLYVHLILPKLRVDQGNVIEYVDANNVYTVADSKSVREAVEGAIARAETSKGKFPKPLTQVVTNYMLQAATPLYTMSETLTQAAQEQAVAKVKDVVEPYPVGKPLTTVGKPLDPATYRVLNEHERTLRAVSGFTADLGPAVLVLLVTVGLIVAVLGLRPRIAENPMRGIAFTALMLATLALAIILRPSHPHALAAAAIGPVMVAAVILCIAYDQRFAVMSVGLLTIVVAMALKLSVGLTLATLAAAVTAVLQLRELRQRGTLIKMGVLTGVIAFAAVTGSGLTERLVVPPTTWEALRAVFMEAGAAALASVVVGFFVLGVLPFIEKAFKVTTAMTLLELCDVNQPLLRQLAQKAPGTYNHSLQVGTLVEAAAESIGADALLARVGAYYHDIGKMHKPQYFVENQAGGHNLHEKLSPAMSLLIIVGHVKDGIEMAREYGLPKQLHHFIESHHGTTLVEYFYHAAKKQKGEKEQPEEIEFRYPGPKPQTKETAILMLCDAVESACRTMPEPTAVRIEQLVDRMAMKRLLDGQFDQCDLTLAELELICESVTKSLCAIYHGRISYPSDREAGKPTVDPRKVVAG